MLGAAVRKRSAEADGEGVRKVEERQTLVDIRPQRSLPWIPDGVGEGAGAAPERKPVRPSRSLGLHPLAVSVPPPQEGVERGKGEHARMGRRWRPSCEAFLDGSEGGREELD